ncbi:MAG TPA: polysaccharide deacetylase family protein [Fervidobacterium sp.]|nr:polysaccharide deacetylase family protein [Fervidobacterium sp.]HUM44400.1 polysaccharide deacetylase family protein [Fervidobacterium sp.]
MASETEINLLAEPSYSNDVGSMEIKSLAAQIANYSGFLDGYSFLRRNLTGSQIVILMYHRVSPQNDNWSLKPLSPQSFEGQIKYFCHNFEVIPLEQLVQRILQEKPLPKKAVIITFDDGYKDNYLYAFPILKKYHIPATFFLTTGHIGTGNLFWWDKVSYAIWHTTIGRLDLEELGSHSLLSDLDRSHANFMITETFKKLPNDKKKSLIKRILNDLDVNIPPELGREIILSWDEVREMSDDNILFGAHTVNHPVLTNLSLEQAKYEILQSKRDIEKELGKEVTSFSYPNGDFNAEIIELVKESGFTHAVSVFPKLIDSKDNTFTLGRIGAGEDFNKFKVAFCGLLGDTRGVLMK